jgi:hypothetical protein
MVIGSFERGAMGIAIFSVSAVCRWIHVSLRISGVCVQHWEGKFFSGWRFRVKCLPWWGSAVVQSSASL